METTSRERKVAPAEDFQPDDTPPLPDDEELKALRLKHMVPESSKMKADWLLGKIGLKSKKDCLACVVYGSRLWGMATSKSDWDFLVVLREGVSLPGAASFGGKGIGEVDVQVLSEEQWQSKISAHSVLHLVIATSLPREAEWWISPDFKSRKNKISKGDLVSSCEARVQKDLKLAAKFRSKNLKRAEKVLKHAIRTLALTLQLLKHNKVLNFEEVTRRVLELRGCADPSKEPFTTIAAKLRLEIDKETATASKTKGERKRR
mmetsp:Transcript_6964/g.13759  ORF Transcript_6964/g.13759 Transcript_6964/m.13759 type:complete len:262 (-) Transcript_6964:154-939(-)